MKYRFDYSEEKNLVLKETRGAGFEEVVEAYKKGNKLANIENKSGGYTGQRLLIVNIKGYAFVAPYVIDKIRKRFFLKTVYPSRKYTEKYLRRRG